MRKFVVVMMLLILVVVLLTPSLLEHRSLLGGKGGELLNWVKDYFASHESGEIAEHLHSIFKETSTLTDEQLDEEISAAAQGVSLTLSPEQVAWVRKLCRRYENMDLSALRETVDEWKEKSETVGKLSEYVDSIQIAGESFKDITREAGSIWDGSKDILTNLRDIFRSFIGTEADLEYKFD